MNNKNLKKTILIDLDGVLNIYDGDFDNNLIPPVKDGAKDFLNELSKQFKIKIFTTRNMLLTAKWIIENELYKYVDDITREKEPAYLYIDDRCIIFNGDYNKLKDDISNFKVWYK